MPPFAAFPRKTETETSYEDIIEAVNDFIDCFFGRNRSTEGMKMGNVDESAVLNSLRQDA